MLTLSQSFTLSNALLADGRLVDIGIRDGRIDAVRPAGSASRNDRDIEISGALIVSAFVDGHIHLDKTLLGLPFLPHQSGTGVADRIRLEKEIRSGLALPVLERGARLIETIVALGTGIVRNHVDIDPDVGLAHLEQVLELKARYAHLIDIQVVAFPQSGILRAEGVADLLDAALAAGADLIGGLDPALIDGNVAGHLDVVFDLAERHGAGVDIHLHEPGELGLFTLRQIAARTAAAGLGGRVTASHAFSLGAPLDIDPTLDALASAGVSIVTNAPGAVPMPPVRRLAAKGVLAFAGSDNIRDAWSPYGNGDMLERAGLVGYRQGLLSDEDLEFAFAMATGNAAQALGLSDYGVEIGCKADLVVLDVASVAEAVATRPSRKFVLKAGRVVARDGQLVHV